jgi:hypothetical protein
MPDETAPVVWHLAARAAISGSGERARGKSLCHSSLRSAAQRLSSRRFSSCNLRSTAEA